MLAEDSEVQESRDMVKIWKIADWENWNISFRRYYTLGMKTMNILEYKRGINYC